MDGLIVWPQADSGGLIQASASVMERVEDLTGAEEDEARFESLLGEPPIVPRHAVSAELQRYLTERADSRSVLAMPFIGSQAYGGSQPTADVVDIRRVV